MSVLSSFPVDLPGGPGEHEHALRWAAIAIGVASVSLALTNAVSIYSWGTDLAPDPRVAQLVDRADRWRAATDGAGLGSPRATMHRMWRKIEAARWPEQRPDRAVTG
jgi:hypothetical protein